MPPSLQPPPRIQAVLFDYGLVLTGPPHPPAWERMQQMLGAGHEAFHEAYWQPRHAYDRGTLNGDAYWHAVAAALGQPLTSPTLAALVEADIDLWTTPNPPMIAWAQHLQARGLRIGILSNLGDAMERGVRDRCPWLARFDHLTFSHNLLLAKPEPEIYHHAVKGLGCAPEHILFVDDRSDNIEAARACGLQALQYLDHPGFERSLQALGLGTLLQPA